MNDPNPYRPPDSANSRVLPASLHPADSGVAVLSSLSSLCSLAVLFVAGFCILIDPIPMGGDRVSRRTPFLLAGELPLLLCWIAWKAYAVRCWTAENASRGAIATAAARMTAWLMGVLLGWFVVVLLFA